MALGSRRALVASFQGLRSRISGLGVPKITVYIGIGRANGGIP